MNLTLLSIWQGSVLLLFWPPKPQHFLSFVCRGRWLVSFTLASADPSGDLPDGDADWLPEEGPEGQGEPAEGGPDPARGEDTQAQRGALQRQPPSQVTHTASQIKLHTIFAC